MPNGSILIFNLTNVGTFAILKAMRDNTWLAGRLTDLHRTYFSDVVIGNRLYAKFGRNSRTRLGSIIAKPHPDYEQPVTCITITGLFRPESVPDYVIEATLVHELAHYAHGFHSPLAQRYQHPHRGNVVGLELKSRGAYHLVVDQEQWLKAEYSTLIRQLSNHA